MTESFKAFTECLEQASATEVRGGSARIERKASSPTGALAAIMPEDDGPGGQSGLLIQKRSALRVLRSNRVRVCLPTQAPEQTLAAIDAADADHPWVRLVER
jgi:hypothetical protein